MQVLIQIILGSGILLVCVAIHLLVAARMIVFLRAYKPLADHPTAGTFFKTVAGVIAVLLISHTLHIYLWAATIWFMGALPGYEEPLYFALVTYTTLGYGDVTLSPDHRILGAMASVTGILMFGLTTAFIVGFLSRVMDTHMR